MIRRQASLYVPETDRNEIERVRELADPVQYKLIPAHVTLCRENEVLDWTRFCEKVSRLGSFDLSLEFGSPIELDNGCLLLPCVKGKSRYNELRKLLLSSRGEEPRVSEPHITLRHPRNPTPNRSVGRLLQSLNNMPPIEFKSVNIIEQQGNTEWKILHEYFLH